MDWSIVLKIMTKKTKKLILELLDFWPMTIVVPTMIILILTANLWNWQNMIADKQMKCCICETEIDNGMDYHNPAPLGKSGDVCCTYCNITKVLPVRIEQTRKITMGRKILVNINKQISLLNNNEINSVIQMIKNRRTELSMKGKNKKQGWEDKIYYGQKNYRDV